MPQDPKANRLRHWLADLLRPSETGPAVQSGPAAARAPRHPDQAPTTERVAFEQGLRNLLGEAKPGMAGHLNIIGMQRIKDKFGKDWGRVAERADRISRNVIKRSLAPGDTFCAWQDSGYLVIFPTLSPEEAQIKCTLIADEITRALIGETEGLAMEATVAPIDGGLMIAEVGYEPGAKPAQSPDEIAMSKSQVAEETAPSAGRYRPVWDTARGAIGTYKWEIDRNNGAASLDGDELGIASIDREAQRQVLTELTERVAQGRLLILILPVSFQTLASRQRREDYLHNLERVPAGAQGYLVIEIVDTPVGVPESRLMALVAPLRRKCRTVGIHLTVQPADFAHFKTAGAGVVSFDLPPTGSEAALIQEMSRFQKLAAKAGLVCTVGGVQTPSLAAAAVGAGFAYINGDAIAAPVQRPGGVAKFDLLDLYRQMLRPA